LDGRRIWETSLASWVGTQSTSECPTHPQTRSQASKPTTPVIVTSRSPRSSTLAHDASVLAQIGAGSGQALTMPNSTKPFVLNWSTSVPSAAPVPSPPIANPGSMQQQQQQQQYPQEYSIFVGDLAPETSNSDLVAVFRNPVLGLRNGRAPKFIRPFLSCKSAKIMLDRCLAWIWLCQVR
jgi:hypothetical protein